MIWRFIASDSLFSLHLLVSFQSLAEVSPTKFAAIPNIGSVLKTGNSELQVARRIFILNPSGEAQSSLEVAHRKSVFIVLYLLTFSPIHKRHVYIKIKCNVHKFSTDDSDCLFFLILNLAHLTDRFSLRELGKYLQSPLFPKSFKNDFLSIIINSIHFRKAKGKNKNRLLFFFIPSLSHLSFLFCYWPRQITIHRKL